MTTKARTRTNGSRIGIGVLGLAVAAGLASTASAQSDPYAHLPASMTLTGTVRDFLSRADTRTSSVSPRAVSVTMSGRSPTSSTARATRCSRARGGR